MSERKYEVIVIGAGAAGMMCAAVAGQRGRRVLLLDHAEKLAEKIRISGGGRCNFTNMAVTPANFLSANPHFCRSALSRFGPHDFIALVERYGIAYHEKTLGQLFCDESSQQIIDMLRAECAAGSVDWAMPCRVDAVSRSQTGGFALQTDNGAFLADSLVVACGGLSIPKIGATPLGYKLAEQFGIPIVPPRPALVPLTLPPETLERLTALSGASFDTIASCAGTRFREMALITHRGLSGPAILQVSSYWQQQAGGAGGKDPICLDLLPGRNALELLEAHRTNRSLLSNILAEWLPRRFAQAWCELHECNVPINQLSGKTIGHIAGLLQAWPLHPSGTQGYAKAEVTLGGVDTRALSSKTMEAREMPGLHFIGEVVDVTGQLGGYNFQWAWSSGYAAGSFA